MLIPIGRGVSLEVADAGSGPVIVLLHGWPVTSLHWRHLIPPLNRAGYRTLAIELRGLGGTSTGPAAGSAADSHAKPLLAREVIAVLDALGVRRTVLIGHGMGGTVAALMAAAQPARTVALVLEEAVPAGLAVPLPPPAPHRPDWHVALLRAPHGVAEALLPGRFDVLVDAVLTAAAGPAGLDFDAHLAYVSAYRGDDRLAATLGLFRSEAEDTAAIRAAARRRTRIPGLAIGGRFGFGGATTEALARLVAGARGLLVPDAGAYPVEQAPDATASALIQFLRAVS
ncbi:alpha/beta fold hydrolase [uncultured Amnibacterium sp.]|uniref:alpha/beta fold hydrolase n=1 Tax=uncultured Amnibacterium sp. TaxID=1631851 RepID=UPI0035CBB4EC